MCSLFPVRYLKKRNRVTKGKFILNLGTQNKRYLTKVLTAHLKTSKTTLDKFLSCSVSEI